MKKSPLWQWEVEAPREVRGVSVNGDGQTKPKTTALAGYSPYFDGPPYDAASATSTHLGAWQPYLWSPDAELNIWRDRIVSRIRDLVRNDGWASGAVTRILDNVIGPNLRPIAKPHWRWMQLITGNKSFDDVWAKEYAKAIDAMWWGWAEGDGFWCDACRNQSFSQLMRVAFRHKLVDGDALCMMDWLPNADVDYGKAKFHTTVALIDPDRLSNPQLQFDQLWMRGGVRINERGAAVGYYIRRAHQSDWFTAAQAVTWDLIPRETSWGRPIIVHDFDGDRASQHRGGAGIFAPVLQRLKMLIKYDEAELDSAIINAVFAAFIESPYDHTLTEEALSDGSQVNYYQRLRKEFHDSRKTVIGNSRIPILFPGEKINSVSPNRPITNFGPFENAVLRNIATAIGLSSQQITNNWADVNYSSARAALLESWKTLDRRKFEFGVHFCSPIRGAWQEEVHELYANELSDVLPQGAPDFCECRGAYSRARWMGPGRGWVDPVAEKQGAVLGMQAALSTLEEECAQQGLDFEEVLEQRKYEIELFKKYDIEAPDWTGEHKGLTPQQRGVQETEGGALPAKPKRPGAGEKANKAAL